jgi:hypothetical protein
MLSTYNAQLADQALDRVRAAIVAGRAAVESRSGFWTYVTGSESAATAENESLRQSGNGLALLESQRPDLTDERLPGFLDAAAAFADVRSLVAAAHLQTTAGFEEQVVAPSVATIKSAATWGVLGLSGVAVIAIVVALFIYFPPGRRR